MHIVIWWSLYIRCDLVVFVCTLLFGSAGGLYAHYLIWWFLYMQ